jgi:hypothetical protein
LAGGGDGRGFLSWGREDGGALCGGDAGGA